MKCSIHNETIRFICSSDVSTLCSNCIPQHSKQHLSSTKAMVITQISEYISQFQKQIQTLNESVITINHKLSQIMNVDKWYELSKLNNLKNDLITLIHEVFSQIQSQFKRIVDLTIEDSQYNISQLIKQTQQIQTRLDFKDFEDPQKVLQFNKSTSLLKQIIKQLENKTDKISQKGVQLPFKVTEVNSIKKQIIQLIYSQIEQQNKYQKKQQAKIQSVQVIKSSTTISSKQQSKLSSKASTMKNKKKMKTCQYCGQELEYLTDLKKHLVCKSCGNKQRNYIKRV